MRASKKMARKLKVYGKKKGQNVVSAFEKLTLSSPSDQGKHASIYPPTRSTVGYESKELTSLHFNLDTKHNRGDRDVLSPTSHNIQQPRQQQEEETRETSILQENQPTQTQDALLHLAISSKNKTKEGCDLSLPHSSKTNDNHQRQSRDLDDFVEHSASPKRSGPNSTNDPAERLEKPTLALKQPAPSSKGKQREANPSDHQSASISRASRITSLRNAASDRKEQLSKSRLAFNETGVKLKGEAKPVTTHGVPEESRIPQSKAPSTQHLTSQDNSGIAPPRTLRSTRHRRDALDPAPVRNLSLDQKTVEHLNPLTQLDCVSRTRDIQLWHAEWTSLCTISKIAEGSYGSVFRMSDKKKSQPETIGKLMPLRAKSGVGSRRASNTTIEAAASEVKLLELMSDVPGFVMFRAAEVLIGALPRALRDEYRAYSAKEYGSNGGSSGADAWFPNHQAWLFIEMDDAGFELDDALTGAADGSGLLQVSMAGQRFLTVKRTRDIVWGVVEALMRGEQVHRFEHRDLHLSNICVKVNKGEEVDSGYELIPPATNVHVTIIDYTLSRATMPDNSLIFNPMGDLNLFQGDGSFDIQFDIYRHMKELVTEPNAAKEGWDAHVPITNVLWISFLLRKLMEWTPRPEETGAEQELWQSLSALTLVIDLDYRWTWDLLSACDVARYMEVGKEEFWEDVKEREDYKVEGEGEAMGSMRKLRRRRMLAGVDGSSSMGFLRTRAT